MIPERCPPIRIGRAKDCNGRDTKKGRQVRHSGVMTKKKSGRHQNSGKCREIKMSKNKRSSVAYLQHTLDRMVISRPLDDNREKALLIKPLNGAPNGFWIKTLVSAAAPRMHKHEFPPPRNPYTLKADSTLFDKAWRNLNESV